MMREPTGECRYNGPCEYRAENPGPSLADRIDSVIESMEIIYNYGFDEGLINAKQILFKDCVKLREIEKELRE